MPVVPSARFRRSALQHQEAELSQPTLQLLWRRLCSCQLLWAKKAWLHQRTQGFVSLSWHPAPSPTDLATVGATTGTAFAALSFADSGPSFTIPNRLCDCWNGGGTALHIITRHNPNLLGGPPRAKPLRFPASPFPLLVPASTHHLPRNAKVSPCDARAGAVPGMAVATQRPPATLTDLTWQNWENVAHLSRKTSSGDWNIDQRAARHEGS